MRRRASGCPVSERGTLVPGYASALSPLVLLLLDDERMSVSLNRVDVGRRPARRARWVWEWKWTWWVEGGVVLWALL